ncbi:MULTISPECIES: hypothetical protein [Shewanella]|uniref:hypothetical protein n=1 Tax=Shewanella TaxID=22 RepID=UPI0021776462|nr:hypothetical protein [Shewanella xiamenensis]MCT8865430.1 hypothetical protein [Shewanella xiamenensis]MCT8869287.1 hypothetical protein [Shewanella xiamenensis]MCT8873870.1 hypothetical protein [Shewanella xiamenensis]MCT8877536.1 hypothetical protein [Shewanella xiamenensis]UWH39970.1 hypothetical protein KXJ80_00265 [Shewanella xiamenensis]
MVINTLPHGIHYALAQLAKGAPITRIHTQWRGEKSSLNVVSYGIREQKKYMHIIRNNRECVAFEVRETEQYSMRVAIEQARAILDSL